MENTEVRKFAKTSSIYAGGNILRQLAGFIMLPVYTRYLEPADYGIIALLTFAISLIDLLFGARMVQAVPKFFHEQSSLQGKYAVISTAMIQTSVISAITMGALLFFRSNASLQLFDSTEYEFIIAMFSITILTQAVENYGLMFIRMQQQPWLFMLLNLSKLIVQLSLNIYLIIYRDMGITGIAISTASTSILYATLLSFITLRKTGIAYQFDIGNRMLIFSWPLWVAGIAGLYIGSANRYYMKVFSSLDDIGLFELASKFSAILLVLIWKPINLYWQTERFKYYKKGESAPDIFNTVFNYSTTLLIIAGLGISLFSEPIVKLMASDAYHPAARIVPILTLAAFFRAIMTFFNFSFFVTENTKWIAKNNYFTMIPATAFFLIFIPPYGFIGAAIASLLTILLQFVIVLNASKKLYDMCLDLKPMYWKVILAIFTCVLANYLIPNDELFWNISGRIILFTISSALILGILFKKDNYRNEVGRFLKSRLSRRN